MSGRKRRAQSDEAYVIDLCDHILGLQADRGHTFEFLRGDPGRHSVGRRLPVDAYYSALNLVVEYKEKQHYEAVRHFDKPHKLTVSGVHRGKQRKRYDERRRRVLPGHGISLVEIPYFELRCDNRGRLTRDREYDFAVIGAHLTEWTRS